MNRTNDSYLYSRVYQEFIDIEQDEFRDIIRFFESNTAQINRLEFKEYFELLFTYVHALYEIEAYHSFVKMADYLLELVIENNIKYYNGEDIFYNVLFRKAKAHYGLTQYGKAEHILKELLKMNASDIDVAHLYRRNAYKQTPAFVKITRISSVVLFILTAVGIGVELFLARTSFADNVSLIGNLRNALFLGGWFLLLGGDLIFGAKIHYTLNQLMKKSRLKNQ